MKIELETLEYSYAWPRDSSREARIIFEKRHDKDGAWELRKCDFFGVGSVYSIDDWNFFRDLGNEIIAQYNELRKP